MGLFGLRAYLDDEGARGYALGVGDVRRRYCDESRACKPCFLPPRPYYRRKVYNRTGDLPQDPPTLAGARAMGLL